MAMYSRRHVKETLFSFRVAELTAAEYAARTGKTAYAMLDIVVVKEPNGACTKIQGAYLNEYMDVYVSTGMGPAGWDEPRASAGVILAKASEAVATAMKI
jgi:hypothetical protein